jgi:hypothetical protein
MHFLFNFMQASWALIIFWIAELRFAFVPPYITEDVTYLWGLFQISPFE